MTTFTSPGQRILRAATDAAAGRQPRSCRADCQPCARSGLQLLIVVPSVIPAEHAAALDQAGYAWAPGFDRAFGEIRREATVPVARLGRPGYYMVYFVRRRRWDVWQIAATGLTRKIMHQVSADQYMTMQAGFIGTGAAPSCSRGAANLPAHLVSITGAPGIDAIWLAYTEHLWAPEVLRRFELNPEVEISVNGKPAKARLRSVLGRELNPAAIMAGEPPGEGCLSFDAATLERHVIDFLPAAPHGDAPQDVLRAFEQAPHPLQPVRFGKAAELERAARAAERLGGERYLNKSLVVMVGDELGVIEAHNHLRMLAVEGKKAWAAGGPDAMGADSDPLRAWKLRSSLHIETIEQWAAAAIRDTHRRNFETGALMSASAYLDRARVRKDFPPGTRWLGEPKIGPDGQPRRRANQNGVHYDHLGNALPAPDDVERDNTMGRVLAPAAALRERVEAVSADQTGERLRRYRDKLRASELAAFREAFRRGSDQWDALIARFDADYAGWLAGTRLRLLMQYGFDRGLDLPHPDSARGTPLQQLADVEARLRATEKAWGGGAVSPVSAKLLTDTLSTQPGDAASPLDGPLLEPFGYAGTILADPIKVKDAVAGIKSLIHLPDTVRQAVDARRDSLEQAMNGVLAARFQGLQLLAAAIDPERARVMGTEPSTLGQVADHFRIHVRTTALMAEILDPADTYTTIRIKLPVGETLDRVAAAFAARDLDMRLEPKNTATRQERRKTANSLRKLAARKGLDIPEFYPVAVSQRTLHRLTAQAVRAGEELVEVIPDPTLGHGQPFKLPKSLALKLVAEQADAAKAWGMALKSGQFRGTGVVAVFQAWALLTALRNIRDAEGYDHADALMAVFSSVSGLLEGGLSAWAASHEIRAAGSRLVLVKRFVAAGALRFAAGIAGAAAAGFDAYAAWVKYQSRRGKGEKEAASAYSLSRTLYVGSTATILVGSSALFARHMAQRAGLEAIKIAGLSFGRAATLATLGNALMGIGILLTIGGFAYSLYALSLEDDLNEIFLKRSYFGNGERGEGRFGDPRPQGNDADALLRWAESGLKHEIGAFNALSIGTKASLEWHANTFGPDVIQAKVEVFETDAKRRLSYTLELLDEAAGTLNVIEDRAAMFVFEESSGRYVVNVKCPVHTAQYRACTGARFTYNLYQEFERVSLGRDVLLVKKGAA